MVQAKKKMSKGQRGDLLFHLALLVWPVLQFTVFYIVVNLNSFKLAFIGEKGFTLDYFKYIFSADVFPNIGKAALTSLEFYLITTIVSVPLGLLFAYYIFKKAVGGRVFRFFLFMPSIVSSMVMVVLFTNFMEKGAVELTGVDGIFNTMQRSSYTWVLIFYLWTNFGTTTLIYSNKMGELSPEILEAAQLDGASSLQEFVYVVLPFAFSTVSVFLVTGLATIFSNQYNLFSIYGDSIAFDSGTLGYYLFNEVQQYAAKGNFTAEAYNRMAALSLVITLVVIPTTLTARWALDKYGPQE